MNARNPSARKGDGVFVFRRGVALRKDPQMKAKTPSCHTLEFRSLAVMMIVCLAMNRGLLKAQSSNVLYTFTTLAGPSGSGVQFDIPFGVAVDSSTNIYVSDSHNQVIRKIAPNGAVPVGGGLSGTSGSADGSGTDARFYDPHAVAIDGPGNLYVADTGNNTIRQITSAGVVSTLAGQAGVS